MNGEDQRLGIPEDDPITWWRAHAEHLRGDLYEVCIPAYNGLPYAAVEVITETVESHHDPQRRGGTSARGRAADWDCWPEIAVQYDRTRAVIHIAELAHHRECAETSCITVWANALQRQRSFGARTFVFGTSPIVGDRFVPVLLPINNCVGRLTHLQSTGMAVDELPAFYDVTPETADDLRALRIPVAEPVDPAGYLAQPA